MNLGRRRFLRLVTAAVAAPALPRLAGAPAEFGKLLTEETEKWAKVVKFSGAKPE